MTIRNFRMRSLLGLLALIGALAACGDLSAPGGHDQIRHLVLTIDGQPVTIDFDGTDDSFILDEGTHAVSAQAYDADGRRLNLHDGDELVIGTSNQGVARYTPLGDMDGTLVTADGNATLRVSIEHTLDTVFGPFNVPVVVN